MADENERALEVAQRADQRVDAPHIEVRRRLVHQQQVRRIQQHLGQRQTRLLPAAEHPDRLEDVVATEQEAAEQRAGELFGRPAVELQRLLEHAALRVQHVAAVLREIARRHIVAEHALARLRREHAGQQLEQRRFARAVRTDQHRALAALGLEIQAPVDPQRLAVAEIDVLQRDDALAGTRRLGEAEFDRLLRVERGVDALHAVEAGEQALGERRLAGLGAELVGQGGQALDFLLLLVEGVLLPLLAGRLVGQVGLVVPAVAGDPLVGELDDRVDELVDELAVVGDQQDGALVVLQVVLEPHQRFEVEVVRRFVEQQQVRLHDQQPREVRAHHPAAGERVGRPVEVAFAERQTAQDRFGLRFELPVGFVVGARHRPGRQLQHSFVAHRGAFLRQKPNASPLFPADAPLVRRVLAKDDRKERGFARAVRPDQGEAVAPVDLQGDVLEQRAAGIGLGNVGNGQHERRAP